MKRPRIRLRLPALRWGKIALAVLMLGLAVYFIRAEGPVLTRALAQVGQAPLLPTILAVFVTTVYVLLSAQLYVDCFRATGGRIPLDLAVRLWLRRNFISVFLPAGGVTSMAFYNRSLRQRGLTDLQVSIGSLLYLLTAYGSLLLVALPVLASGLGSRLPGLSATGPLLTLVLLVGLGGWLVRSFRRNGRVYRRLVRLAPALADRLEPLRTLPIDRVALWKALVVSIGIEGCGIAHVFLAVWAMHGAVLPLAVAASAYVTATLLYALSPALRGLGAVEVSLTLVLIRLGHLPDASAVAATLYYRLFEFWLPLLVGLFGFFWVRTNLLLRVLPAFLTLLLGVVNLLSALTPGLPYRVRLLEEFLPMNLLPVSNGVVIGAGLLLVLLSVGLLRGYRPAWLATVGLVIISIVAHLTKAIDYEEALFAGFVLLVLLYTCPGYRLASPPVRRLLTVRGQRSATTGTDPAARATARRLTERYGQSSLDYFKLSPDKELFVNAEQDGFLAYRRAGRHVVVLEGPVLADRRQYASLLRQFEADCQRHGWSVLYVRVDEADLPFYASLGKRYVRIGQEGLVDLDRFTLAGRDHKALRNALKRIESGGYVTRCCEPPLRDALVQQLRAVSDEWLRTEAVPETGFSQGVFRPDDIKQQPVVLVENPEGKVVAFANLIPDFAPGEGTYDLIRKTDDAPSGVMDALMVGLIQALQQRGCHALNLGLAPLSGIDAATALPEQALKLAYERGKPFAHFRGLRFFKEKYADQWQDKYLVYGDDLDLIQALVALQRVSRYPPVQSDSVHVAPIHEAPPDPNEVA